MLIRILFITNFSIENSYKKIKKNSKNMHEKIQKNRQNAQKKKAKKVQSPAQHDMQVETAEEMDMPTPSITPDDLDVQYTYKETKSGQLEIDIDEEPMEEAPMEQLKFKKQDNEPYNLPPVQLLNEPQAQSQQREKSQITKTVQLLKEKYKSIGVQAKIPKAHIDPD